MSHFTPKPIQTKLVLHHVNDLPPSIDISSPYDQFFQNKAPEPRTKTRTPNELFQQDRKRTPSTYSKGIPRDKSLPKKMHDSPFVGFNQNHPSVPQRQYITYNTKETAQKLAKWIEEYNSKNKLDSNTLQKFEKIKKNNKHAINASNYKGNVESEMIKLIKKLDKLLTSSQSKENTRPNESGREKPRPVPRTKQELEDIIEKLIQKNAELHELHERKAKRKAERKAARKEAKRKAERKKARKEAKRKEAKRKEAEPKEAERKAERKEAERKAAQRKAKERKNTPKPQISFLDDLLSQTETIETEK